MRFTILGQTLKRSISAGMLTTAIPTGLLIVDFATDRTDVIFPHLTQHVA